ncbi:MAG: hypothetical protein AAFP90_04485, partial [Planctomycetota bacterium]
MFRRFLSISLSCPFVAALAIFGSGPLRADEPTADGNPSAVLTDGDHVRDLQMQAAESNRAVWGHWGPSSTKYSNWTNHSNRLIPVYTFGIGLDSWRDAGSPYRDAARLEALYGQVPKKTLNASAEYFDQTQIYELQR